MRYFHTSNIVVSEPDVYHSRKHLDFGMGFYLTPFEKQARDYGQRSKYILPTMANGLTML